MEQTQLAYLAGAIDGEGSLSITRKVNAFAAHVTITNTKLEWLETLKEWIGDGRVEKVGPNTGRFNRRQCYRLALSQRIAVWFLPLVKPFMLIKAHHADLLLEYFDLAYKRRRANLPGMPSAPEWIERIEAIRSELKRINLRGLTEPKPALTPIHKKCSLSTCERKRWSNGFCKVHYKKYVERGGPAWHELPCAKCGKVFVSKRKDARCCSKTCTDRLYYERSRLAAKVAV